MATPIATPTHDALDARPSYLAAAIAAALVLALYVITLGPSTAMWDTSEYIAAAYIMGIPHPPGNPFFVLIGRVFSLLPIAPTVGARINILAALSQRRLGGNVVPDHRARARGLAAAAVAAHRRRIARRRSSARPRSRCGARAW